MPKKTPLPTKYSLVPDPYDADSAYWCIKLESGEFAGVIVQIHDMGVADRENAEGQIPLTFKHDIVFIPEELRQTEFPDEKRQEFVNMLGGILVALIHESVDSVDETISEDVEGRTTIKKRIDFSKLEKK